MMVGGNDVMMGGNDVMMGGNDVIRRLGVRTGAQGGVTFC